MNADNRATPADKDRKEDKGKLENLAEKIDPPSREVSDAELIDPGKNIPPGKPGDEETARQSGNGQRSAPPKP